LTPIVLAASFPDFRSLGSNQLAASVWIKHHFPSEFVDCAASPMTSPVGHWSSIGLMPLASPAELSSIQHQSLFRFPFPYLSRKPAAIASGTNFADFPTTSIKTPSAPRPTMPQTPTAFAPCRGLSHVNACHPRCV